MDNLSENRQNTISILSIPRVTSNSKHNGAVSLPNETARS